MALLVSGSAALLTVYGDGPVRINAPSCSRTGNRNCPEMR